MLNKATLIGRVGKEPEIRVTKKGTTIATLGLATSEYWKDKQGDRQEKTEWHNIVFFDRLADIVKEYVSKGDLIYLEGKIQTDKYQGKDGVLKYSTKIQCQLLKMLGGKEKQKEEKKEEETTEQQDISMDDDIPF